MSLTFERLRAVNVSRCESADGYGHKLGSWSLSDWMTAAVGEVGEAANVIKKLNRERDGIGHHNNVAATLLQMQLKDEIADAIVYLDLLAAAAGFTLEDAVRDKFNRKSVEKGMPFQL